MNRFFEWDELKAETNFRKHGIRFEDAVRVFDDPLAVVGVEGEFGKNRTLRNFSD